LEDPTLKILLPLLLTAALAPGLMKGYGPIPPATQANVDKGIKLVQAGSGHDAEAYKLLEPAARQGNRAALFMMGFFSYYGRGGQRKDASKALAPLARAADLGYPGALRLLGSMYFNAEGTPRDIRKGYAYMKVAEVMGDTLAHRFTTQANDSLGRADLAEAHKQAVAWVKKHPFQDAAEQKRLLAALDAKDAFKKIKPDTVVPLKLKQ
jgi:TPR repeat protein